MDNFKKAKTEPHDNGVWVTYEEAKQFKDILKELEWSGEYTAEDGSEIDRSCPICRNERYQGHKEDCRLNNLLVGEVTK
jgi:hypothetical protein